MNFQATLINVHFITEEQDIHCMNSVQHFSGIANTCNYITPIKE
jgi:hypothetical protein